MGTRLYVGSLSYSTTQDSLQQAFSQAGTVTEAVVIADKFSGRSKGFGFVTMGSDAEAQKAIEVMNGQELDGRRIVVNEARPMGEQKPRRSFGGGGGGGGYGRGGGYGGGGRQDEGY